MNFTCKHFKCNDSTIATKFELACSINIFQLLIMPITNWSIFAHDLAQTISNIYDYTSNLFINLARKVKRKIK